jgi:hypothetical protein
MLPNNVQAKYRPPTVTLPTVYQYNATLERQLTNKIVVSGGYVGNSSRHNFLGTSQNINTNEAVFVPGVTNTNLDKPFFNQFGWTQSLEYYCDCSNDQYNSFQSTVKVNYLAGWTLQGNYTYQRQWGPGWDPYDSNYYFLYDRSAGYGYSSILPRNQITIAQNYEVPFGHGKKFGANISRPADFAFGGWVLGGITTYYSGLPFSPTLGTSYPGQPNVGPNGRPDIGSGSPYSGAQGNRNQWFVGESLAELEAGTGPFTLPAANEFGNYPINTLFGPHFIQQDFSISKRFAITERVGFALRMDSTNFFNHTNLGTPNNNITSGSAGQITGIAFGGNNGIGMRKLQFSGKINF